MTKVQDNRAVTVEMGCPEIGVSFESICRAAGWHDGNMGDVPDDIVVRLREVVKDVRPLAGYVLRRDVVMEGDGFTCGGLRFESGRVICEQLAGAEALAFFVATAGEVMERKIRRAASGGDVLLQYVLDAAGSEIAEAAAERVEGEVGVVAEGLGWRISNRLSPGYCGWDVEEQRKLFSLLPADFCGITLTESALMIPIKSVSGVIALGGEVRRRASACEICDLEGCSKRQGCH